MSTFVSLISKPPPLSSHSFWLFLTCSCPEMAGDRHSSKRSNSFLRNLEMNHPDCSLQLSVITAPSPRPWEGNLQSHTASKPQAAFLLSIPENRAEKPERLASWDGAGSGSLQACREVSGDGKRAEQHWVWKKRGQL